jgi:hypothetical protein
MRGVGQKRLALMEQGCHRVGSRDTDHAGQGKPGMKQPYCKQQPPHPRALHEKDGCIALQK